MNEKIIILDFGSQYTQLIARRTRELKVFAEIHPYYISQKELQTLNPQAIILSGSPSSVYQQNAPKLSFDLTQLNIPILGICYGLQLIARYFHMLVEPAPKREYGLAQLKIAVQSRLLKNVKNHSQVWMSHGDKISQFPKDFLLTAGTDNSEVAVIESEERKIYGVQFHPEVVHTHEGKTILSNFLFEIANLKPTWDISDFISNTIDQIREKVGKQNVLLGLSGGVDSTVLALLLHKAIGDQLKPVFVDTGLLRKNEFTELMDTFKKNLGLKVIGIQTAAIFLNRLQNVRSAEKKRKIIGKTFIEVFSTVSQQFPGLQYFAQGTLYPDVIESVSVNGPSATIKSHHNVGGLPKKLKFKLIEPFRELFKDEVRAIGRKLGLDEKFIMRHPFPGPGLAVRILGAITEEKILKLQEADAILIEELHKFDLYNKIWQAFAVLLPVKSVGVMGDERTYENVAVLRMVESIDGMTADWFPAPSDFLKAVSNRIVNEVKGINRVTYDLTSKPPGTIEWE